LADLDGAGLGRDLAGLVVAVADDEPVALVVDQVGVLVDVAGDLGQQGGRQHLAGAFADDLVDRGADSHTGQRPRRRVGHEAQPGHGVLGAGRVGGRTAIE